MTTQHTDGWLVVRIRDGDIEALGELYEKYKALIYRTALAITREERAAEDILQDVFLRVHTYADRLDETVTLAPWLYRVTVNSAYTWANQGKRWFYLFQDTLDRLVTSPQCYPEAAVEEQEWRQMIQHEIDALPPKHRVVIVLHYLEGLSLKEITYVTDVPEGTVKSRLHYARKKLRKTILGQERRLAPEAAYDFT